MFHPNMPVTYDNIFIMCVLFCIIYNVLTVAINTKNVNRQTGTIVLVIIYYVALLQVSAIAGHHQMIIKE
jgi:hypothetical protein